MAFQNLVVDKEDDIAWIRLNRPSVLNALSMSLVSELLAALDKLEKDPEVKVIILRGNGKAFCAGADLSEYPRPGGKMGDDIGFSGLWDKIEHLEKPVIAAVHGYAITGGFLLTYCSDLVIAAENTKFADTHAKWGLVPTAGESQRLPRRIGIVRAKELMFTSDFIDARYAEKLGLVNRVVPEDKLDEEARRLAKAIAQNSAKSLKALKMLINRGMEVDFATGLRLEAMTNRWGRANVEPDEDRDRRLGQFRKG